MQSTYKYLFTYLPIWVPWILRNRINVCLDGLWNALEIPKIPRITAFLLRSREVLIVPWIRNIHPRWLLAIALAGI